jgi:hypothetical protein
LLWIIYEHDLYSWRARNCQQVPFARGQAPANTFRGLFETLQALYE